MAKGLTLQNRHDLKSIRTRFDAKYVPVPSGCWQWTASTARRGYGQMGITKPKRNEKAHRISYALNVADIPPDRVIMHTCDNPGCVNPQHLRMGTQIENLADRDAKNRHARVSGVRNPSSKLSCDALPVILDRSIPIDDLASRFGVSRSTIDHVRAGRTWR